MGVLQQTRWWMAGLIAFVVGPQTLVAQRPSPQALAANNRSLIKAPTFDKEVLDLFATDARTQIGPGELPGKKKVIIDGGDGKGTPPDGPPAAGGGGSFAWSKLISSDSLESEIKSLGSVAAEAVKTQNNFKSKGREVAARRVHRIGHVVRRDPQYRRRRKVEERCVRIAIVVRAGRQQLQDQQRCGL